MHNGIDYHNTMSVLRSLKDTHYAFKCALETIMPAGAWPYARIHEHKPSVSPLCPRYGQACDSSLHCFWQCPATELIEDETVSSTENLWVAAEKASVDEHCLWLRGILPSVHAKNKPVNLPPRHCFGHIC